MKGTLDEAAVSSISEFSEKEFGSNLAIVHIHGIDRFSHQKNLHRHLPSAKQKSNPETCKSFKLITIPSSRNAQPLSAEGKVARVAQPQRRDRSPKPIESKSYKKIYSAQSFAPQAKVPPGFANEKPSLSLRYGPGVLSVYELNLQLEQKAELKRRREEALVRAAERQPVLKKRDKAKKTTKIIFVEQADKENDFAMNHAETSHNTFAKLCQKAKLAVENGLLWAKSIQSCIIQDFSVNLSGPMSRCGSRYETPPSKLNSQRKKAGLSATPEERIGKLIPTDANLNIKLQSCAVEVQEHNEASLQNLSLLFDKAVLRFRIFDKDLQQLLSNVNDRNKFDQVQKVHQIISACTSIKRRLKARCADALLESVKYCTEVMDNAPKSSSPSSLSSNLVSDVTALREAIRTHQEKGLSHKSFDVGELENATDAVEQKIKQLGEALADTRDVSPLDLDVQARWKEALLRNKAACRIQHCFQRYKLLA